MMSIVFFASLMAVMIGREPGIRLYDQFHRAFTHRHAAPCRLIHSEEGMLPSALIVTGHRSFSKLLATHTTLGRRLVRTAAIVLGDDGVADGRMLAGQQVNARALAIKEFTDRINDYVALQKKLAASLKQAPTDSPAQIEVRQKALAQAIRTARQKAKPGDIFGDAGKQFREIIRQDARERSDRDIYAAMQEVPRQAPPRVNVDYPEKAALATVPPLILKRLPRPAGRASSTGSWEGT